VHLQNSNGISVEYSRWYEVAAWFGAGLVTLQGCVFKSHLWLVCTNVNLGFHPSVVRVEY